MLKDNSEKTVMIETHQDVICRVWELFKPVDIFYPIGENIQDLEGNHV